MKRIFIIFTTALLLLVACVPTPEEEVVIQKDFEKMIEKAQATPAEDTIAIQGTCPEGQPGETPEPRGEHISESFTGRTDAFRVIIDADIYRPDGPLPIVRVQPDEFNAERAQPYFAVLADGEDYYTQEELETKETLEQEIAEMQAEVDAGLPSLDRDGLSERDVQKEIKHWKSQIKELQERWKTAKDAPGEPVRNLSDVDWSKVPYYLPTGVWSKDKQATFTFRLDSRQEQNGKIIRTVDSSVFYADQRKKPETKAPLYQFYRDVTGQTMIPNGTNLKKTPTEVQTEAEELLRQIGVKDMAADRVYLMREVVLSEGNEGFSINDQLPADHTYQYLYEVRFCRTINGIPVVKPSEFASSSIHSETAYAPSWEYECLYVRIGNEGVCEFYHLAPIEVVNTVVEDATLKPFSDILDVARKMLPIMHEEEVTRNDEMENLTFYIDRITLSLQRVAEQDNLQYGLLVPTWNFWGVDRRTYTHGSVQTYLSGVHCDPSCGYLPLLSINAIDGSIIDPMKGY